MNAGKLNPFVETINMLFNFFILNLVFLITCLPVITIGAALSSLYYVVIKETKGEAGYLVRPYLREFRRNFKNGTIAFLILTAIGALLLFNLLFWPVQGNPFSYAVTGVLAVIALYIPADRQVCEYAAALGAECVGIGASEFEEDVLDAAD